MILMALGRWFPAARDSDRLALQTVSSRQRAAGPNSNLAPKIVELKNDCNEIDWVCYMTLFRRLPQGRNSRSHMLLRGVNSMDKPNGRLVLVSYMHYCTSTSSLSTRWSSWALQGNLILERASRLYAFSGYHNRTSLPSRAFGKTTGTQEVRPSRSSRTKDSPPQISYAHSR